MVPKWCHRALSEYLGPLTTLDLIPTIKKRPEENSDMFWGKKTESVSSLGGGGIVSEYLQPYKFTISNNRRHFIVSYRHIVWLISIIRNTVPHWHITSYLGVNILIHTK